ncbi:MAG TPA: thiamine pyrophosphate-dependent enzyme [Candidatus Limnocylindrales bacterium]|nr:thiamine pyrophosphate-dependent enzyme [Candidatus Limnocylindrales bacterium]
MTDDPTHAPELAGEGLLAPHGLEDVGEAIAEPDGAEQAGVPDVAPEASPEASPEATPEASPEAGEPSRPTRRTVARLIADTLRGAGVKFAFTVPGESFLGLLEAFGDAGIRVVATRHESGAAFMAEAYGQLTGRPAACLGTRAVGAANLAIGIHTARADSTPMFVLVGDVERALRGREAFQEVDLPTTIGGLAAWAGAIDEPETAPAVLAEAIRRALAGRPAPVLIACREDALDLEAGGGNVPIARPALSRPDPNAVRAVIRLLAAAVRPVILAGAGVLRARCSRELVRFAELLGVPVVASWRRGDLFPNDHPLYLGMSGYFAAPSARERLETADAMLVLGCRLNEPTSLGYTVPAPGARWAHVDVDPTAWADRERAAETTIAADAGVFLRAAVARLEAAALDAAVTDLRQVASDEARARYEATTTVDGGDWDGPGVHPGRVVTSLRSVLPDDAIVTTDAGNFGGWLARGYRFRRPATFLGPTSGAMGYALPAAIAAAIVHRDRPVVAVAGDGGFAMTMAELETAVRERVRPIVLVFDNERYGTIRMHQERRRPDGPATDLGPIDFVRVAEGLGAHAERVESAEAFEPALRRALAGSVPVVLHLPLDRRWVSVDETPV